MGDVIKFVRPSLKEKAKGVTLCRSGHHKWTIDQRKQFDVKSGKLVTIRRCTRCNATRTTLD
ncbi:MAG: hypothetical protein H6993_19045 [Pseudomonadales bacterium]|nr:hypothetical protein [Pseudomonadales bacterium]MCP5186072.1 hypothetical protein [Pseudomonadales bacterium]